MTTFYQLVCGVGSYKLKIQKKCMFSINIFMSKLHIQRNI